MIEPLEHIRAHETVPESPERLGRHLRHRHLARCPEAARAEFKRWEVFEAVTQPADP